MHLSIYAALQVKAGADSAARLAEQHLERGSIVAMDPVAGDLLASVNSAFARSAAGETGSGRSGRTAAGSRALRALSARLHIQGGDGHCCAPGESARSPTSSISASGCPTAEPGTTSAIQSGPFATTWRIGTPHGTLRYEPAIVVSCNAYFAQLGTYKVGPEQLLDTAKAIGVSVANPATVKNLKPQMPQASYGQGQVVVSPFQMARVAAAIAAGGKIPLGRWVTDDSNTRTNRAAVCCREYGRISGEGHARRGDQRHRAAPRGNHAAASPARRGPPNWRRAFARLVHRLRAL